MRTKLIALAAMVFALIAIPHMAQATTCVVPPNSQVYCQKPAPPPIHPRSEESTMATYNYSQAEATTNVYSRVSPSSSAATVYLFQGGQIVYYFCYVTGQSLNGDNVWYRTRPNPAAGTPQGYVPGWYMTTGADPNPSVSHC
jgi:hypothetical protein